MSARRPNSKQRLLRDKARLVRARRNYALSQVVRDCLLEDRTLLATTQFAITGLVSPYTAGALDGFTITAEDAQGQVTPNYAGTVHFTSSDPQATLPANVDFAGSNGQVSVAAGSLIFRTDGSDTLTATDTSDSSITSTVIVPVSPPSTVMAAVQGNTLYVLGDASTDSVSLSLTANHTRLQVLNNGSAVAGSPFAISSFSSVDVIGGTGSFSLAVDTGLASPSDPIKGGIQFTGGSAGNTLDAPNQANHWSVAGTDMGTLDTAVKFAQVQNLTGSDGGDTFTFGAQGSVQGVIRGGLGGTTLDGGSGTLNVTNNVLTTGNLTIEAGTIAVAPAVTISSRQTGGANPLTGDSTGNSGNIAMTAPSITLNQGDLVLAQVEPGSQFQAGNVTLAAELSSVDQPTQASSTPNQAQIGVTRATVEGGDISITAGASNINYYDDLGAYGALASTYINSGASPGAEPGRRHGERVYRPIRAQGIRRVHPPYRLDRHGQRQRERGYDRDVRCLIPDDLRHRWLELRDCPRLWPGQLECHHDAHELEHHRRRCSRGHFVGNQYRRALVANRGLAGARQPGCGAGRRNRQH